jgi:hypothetical protein
MSTETPDGLMVHGIPQRKLGVCCFCGDMMWLMELPESLLLVHIEPDAQGRRAVKMFPCQEYTDFWQRNYWQAWEDKLTEE